MKQRNTLLPSAAAPWTQTPSAYDNVVIIAAAHRQIGTLTAPERLHMKGDVAFLLRAVNSHAALVKALLAAGSSIEQQRAFSGDPSMHEELYAQILAALEAAHVRVDLLPLSGKPDDAGPLVHANWRFDHHRVPATPEELVAAVIKEDAELRADNPDLELDGSFGADPAVLLQPSGMRELDISMHDAKTRTYVNVRIGDGTRELSWGDIVLLLHRAWLDQFAKHDPDHCFFEGLTAQPTKELDVPLFSAFMGS